MKTELKKKIDKECKDLFKKIDKSLPLGAIEVEEDKIIESVCKKYGFTLSNYYGDII